MEDKGKSLPPPPSLPKVTVVGALNRLWQNITKTKQSERKEKGTHPTF